MSRLVNALVERLAEEGVTEYDHALRLARLRRWLSDATPGGRFDARDSIGRCYRLTTRGRQVAEEA